MTTISTRTKKDEQEVELDGVDVAVHRRVLNFLNEATRPQDLMFERTDAVGEGEGPHEDNTQAPGGGKTAVLDEASAREVVAFRDREFPLGFRNLRELAAVPLRTPVLEALIRYFSEESHGSWSFFPEEIPRRGPGGFDGVVHAAMLHTGKVLFITADETTLLWNPEGSRATSAFKDPVNQPHQTPDTATGYSVLCGGHSFLSDGRLLVVGGGGYGHNSRAVWGYKFDPTERKWSRTAGRMAHSRWYPTVLTLGDQRHGDSHEVLVTCGDRSGHMEIYDEASDSFVEVTGDTLGFPNLYPGLHLLPNHSVFIREPALGHPVPVQEPSPATIGPPTSCSAGATRGHGTTSPRSLRQCRTGPRACRSCS